MNAYTISNRGTWLSFAMIAQDHVIAIEVLGSLSTSAVKSPL
jgi:hypothetical protein